MPITTQAEYEIALEQIVRRLDADPGARNADPVLRQLMADVDAYHPTFSAPQPPADGASERARELIARAEALRERFARDAETTWGGMPNDGNGVGPTTGA